ncbi:MULTISPECIES: hypothetical protein [Pseudoalteromonas]|uniref:Uncharacterized protein n=1 Tax=Pseudoalteromonas amylolytica TaxID=1859457 RepID=A0A1S1MSW4_9GAMM|nr:MULTISPECIES: hypothetical protein [Pseudoalteromonas]OHU89044.1 hypothetical protein BFC16_05185 [Pseudoalteromonas sp. JW3]OHU91944.1 hypothetical protein BET10_06290 [Pseudoalteromonas amylolytica]
MLKLKKKLINYEVIISLYFTLHGVFLYYNPEYIDESKIKILYFLTPMFFVVFLYVSFSFFRMYKNVTLCESYLSLDDRKIDMNELIYVNVHIIYAFESFNWARKVEVYYKYNDGEMFFFSGVFSLNARYETLIDMFKGNGKIIIDKNNE